MSDDPVTDAVYGLAATAQRHADRAKGLEAIVRDLARRDDPGVLLSNSRRSLFCCFCLGHLGVGEDHRPDCVWRRAVEWVSTQEDT